MARQLHFYRLANELRSANGLPLLPPDRRLDETKVEQEVAKEVENLLPQVLLDVSDCFNNCQSKMVKQGISKGSVMLALPLPGLSGLIGTKQLDDEGAQIPRLGRELAGAAKLAGVKGVFHSDELPAYGIDKEQVDEVSKALGNTESDAFILCLAPRWQAELALESVLNRARLAWHRIPQEVRNVVVKKGSPEDGTTSPMRPLPGGARMYPETDIPTKTIDANMWQNIQNNLPMTDEQRQSRLNDFDISKDQQQQLLAREMDDIFVEHIGDLPAKGWATVLLENDTASPILAKLVLTAKENGDLTKEGINQVIHAFRDKPIPEITQIAQYADENDLKPADSSELQSIIDEIIIERTEFIKQRGMGAMGPLMGIVMQKAGAADGKVVSSLLKDAIQQVIQ